ncbi:MAG: hypothetical protein M8350_04620 [Methanosarcinaceae archaeon]|nr:hypothetical protein [Methanosarcinaceae archaeon]
MKVRIEIFEDDGSEKANAQFNGKLWKEYVINFINSVDDTELPTTEPSSKTPSQQQAQYNINTAIPSQQQMPPNPQLQNYPYPPNPYQNPNPNPTMQQPYYYYPQPVQYQPQFQTPPPVYPQQLQQAIFPNNQPPQPQQYTAQPVATLQPHAPLQTQTRQSQVPLRDKIKDTTLTISERLELFLKYEYPHVWFTSQEIQGHYERVYGFIKLSTVSTYLSRMYRKTLLDRRGNRTQREYMYISNEFDSRPHTEYAATPAISEFIR